MRRFVLIPICTALLSGCLHQETLPEQPAATSYERIEYLSDHLAIGISGGTAFLLTTDGTVVATDEDTEALRAGAEAAWARFQDEEFACWEAILDQYDSLCNACIARRPADELLDRLDGIKRQIQGAVGRMDPQQQTRFAAIRERYERYRR